MLTFDPIKHEYRWNDKIVPSVSSIIKTIGIGKNYLENEKGKWYRDRGIVTHQCIKMYLGGTLDMESVDPVVKPFLSQAIEWIDKNEIGILDTVEQMYYSKQFNYAGTIDLIAYKIYDWKCTKNVDPVTEIQGAMYKQLVLENTLNELEFSAIQLDGSDGQAIEIPYDAKLSLVPAVMTLYRDWKKKEK